MDVDGMILLALLVGGDYHPVSTLSCCKKCILTLAALGWYAFVW